MEDQTKEQSIIKEDEQKTESVILKNSFFVCPNCLTKIPIIQSIWNDNGEQFIQGKCQCGDFKESLISYLKKLENIEIKDSSECRIRAHSPIKADVYCYDCNRTLCTNCYTIHLDFFEGHFSFPYKPTINDNCNKHPEKEYISYCNNCQIALCEQCLEEHKSHEVLSIEISQNKLKDKYINEFKKAENICHKYLDFIEQTQSEILKGDFTSKEEIKDKIIAEYEKWFSEN